MIHWIFNQLSQALGVLCIAGILAGVWRWKTAIRRDLLLAWIMYLSGTAIREGVVYVWGGLTWDMTALSISAGARCLQLFAAAMFIRAVTRETCPPWMMASLLLFIAAVVLAI